jgi:hypothetical protein
MANYTSTHTGATIDASVTIISGSGVTQSDLVKLNAVTSSAVELNLLDGVTASTAELNILDGATLSVTELNYLDGADSSITTLSLPDNTTITTFGASLVDDADAASARTTLGVDVAGTDNSTNVTLVTTSHDYLSLSGQAITLGQIDISDDTNLVGGDGLALTGDTLSVNVDDSSIEINSDTLRVKASGVTNAMLAGSIVNAKLSNSSLSYGGVSVALGSSDATPAFDLSDATSLPIVAGTTGTLSVARGGTGATTASGARTNLNVDVAGTDNSTDVTLVTTSHDYLSLSGQAVTLGTIDIGDDTNLVGGTGITLTGDTLSTTDSEIVHDNLSGFVANEHIDHSGVSITAGAGLTGGGDITSTRDIAVGAGTGVTVNADDIAIGQDVATNADVTFNTVTADIIGDIRGATKFQAKADVALNKGDAVYISGVSGTTPTVDIADANDSAKMPSSGLAASSVSINASVEIITFGTLAGLNTSAFSVGDIIYISTNGTSGNTLTATPPTGETSLIQNIGKVQRSHASAGSIKVGGAGRSNATPNLNDGNIFIGNGSNQAVTASLNTKIESYLDGGTSTANFDTISVDGVEITATPAELNKLDGVTSTTAELNYTDGVTSNIQTQLDLKAPLASPAFTGTATGANLTLSGDLTVNGSTTTLDTTNLAVEDNLMELNAGVTSNANDSGFLIERGTTGDNAIFMWDESADKFTLGTTTATGTTTGDITLSSTGTLVANVEGDVTGAVTGNADTATTLATARNFSLTGDVTAGAVSFDGSGNVALSTTIAANSVALGTDTTGNYMSDLTEGTGIDISHTPAEGSNGTITLDLTEVGFGGGANRLITDDGDGTVSTEANLTFDGTNLDLPDSKKVRFGTDNDFEFYHDDTNAVINNTKGDLQIYNNADDKDIVLLSDDGSGGTTAYLTLDGSSTDLLLTPPGNVGIGTASPAHKTTIYSDSTTDSFPLVVGQPNSANEFVGIGLSGFVASNGAVKAGLVLDRKATYGVGDIHILNNTTTDNSNATLSDSKLTILQNGNVGIGTTSPTDTLQVEGSIGVGVGRDAQLTAVNNGLAIRNLVSDADMLFYVNDGGVDTEAMRIDGATANVGIGTTSPSYLLHLSGTAPELAFTDTDGSATWRARAVTNNFHITETGAGDPFVIQSGAGANALVINSSGNVGIGTASPGEKLEVSGNIKTTAHLVLPYGEINDAGTDLNIVGTNAVTLQSSAGTALTIPNASTNVGIGTTSPSNTLEVKSGSTTPFGIKNASNSTRLQVSLTNDDADIFLYDRNGTLQTALRSEGDSYFNQGNVGIGTTSPGASLDVKSQINVTSANNDSLVGLKGTRFGYSTSYKVVQIGNTSGNESVSIGYDPSGNSSGSFTGDGREVLFRNGVEFTTPNSGNDGFHNDILCLKDGKVGIGTASPSTKLEVASGNSGGDAALDSPTIRLNNTTQSTDWDTGDVIGTLEYYAEDASGNAPYVTSFIKSVNETGNGTLPSGALTFGVADYDAVGGATEAMRIDSDGNVSIGNTAPTQKLDMNGKLKMRNTSTPSAEANAAMFFANSGEMRVMDASGNNTLLSPHNFELIPEGASEDRAWSYYSENQQGQKVNVDMMRLARLVEKLTGEKLVYTEED